MCKAKNKPHTLFFFRQTMRLYYSEHQNKSDFHYKAIFCSDQLYGYSIAFREPAISMSFSLIYSIAFTDKVNTSVNKAAKTKHDKGISG